MDRIIKRGDIYYANLNPVIGSEQGGTRPVLIISNDTGNKHSPTVIVAAITGQIGTKKKLPTHTIVHNVNEAQKFVDKLICTNTISASTKYEKNGYIRNFQENNIIQILIELIDNSEIDKSLSNEYDNLCPETQYAYGIVSLMRSIEDKGVLVPLVVRSNPHGDGYEIIAGHRRKAACTWAGIEEVPVILRELDDSDAVIAMISIL